VFTARYEVTLLCKIKDNFHLQRVDVGIPDLETAEHDIRKVKCGTELNHAQRSHVTNSEVRDGFLFTVVLAQ
jgi:hypothetical protein